MMCTLSLTELCHIPNNHYYFNANRYLITMPPPCLSHHGFCSIAYYDDTQNCRFFHSWNISSGCWYIFPYSHIGKCPDCQLTTHNQMLSGVQWCPLFSNFWMRDLGRWCLVVANVRYNSQLVIHVPGPKHSTLYCHLTYTRALVNVHNNVCSIVSIYLAHILLNQWNMHNTSDMNITCLMRHLITFFNNLSMFFATVLHI